MTDPYDLAPVRHPADPPEVSPEALLAAIRACVAVVGPGDVLAARIPAAQAADRDLADRFGGMARQVYRDHGMRVVFLAAEEFAVIRKGDSHAG